MKNKMVKISVQNKHIKKGKPRESNACPIYWAVKDMCQFALADEINVNCRQISAEFSRGFKCVEKGFRLPMKAQRFVERFDDGMPVKPFSFCVKL